MPQSTVILGAAEYPRLLGEIQDPPERLFVRGALPNPNAVCLAIVGTRKASREGMKIAGEFAEYFAGMGVVIVSGLATGIDESAHRGALSGGGVTVAILGTSLDKIYPVRNSRLAGQIVQQGGALISEYSPEEPIHKWNFIRRNRIISGFASAILIVEAPPQSGSLATARFAAEQGREVFVVPGAVRERNYIGSHDLIRDGATLVASPMQLAEDMGWKSVGVDSERGHPDSNLNGDEGLIVQLLHGAGTPLRVDKIIELTKLEPRRASVGLASLIIRGLIMEDTTGYKLK